MSLSESHKSDCLGLLWKYLRRKKEEEEFASTRTVGFAADKNTLDWCRSPSTFPIKWTV